MKKALMVASVASMIDQFNMENIKLLQKMGYRVHVACNFLEGNTSPNARNVQFKKELEAMNVTFHQIDFSRRGIAISQHISAYKQLKFILEKDFKLIHLHSPIGGAIGRLAARKSRKKGTRIIYTAHGFHFYQGGPLINWLLYYPVERWLSRYTDELITINQEDYNRSKKFKKTNAVYVPGVGIDLEEIRSTKIDRDRKREELGIPKESFLMTSVGELSKRKNHEVVIRALGQVNNSDIHYIICGQGDLEEELKELTVSLNLEDQVHFLGFRRDIIEINMASDLFVFPSYQEGLPVALMEAMAAGLAVVASDIRGNEDLIDQNGGFLISPDNIKDWAKSIGRMYDETKENKYGMGIYNKEQVVKYELPNVIDKMASVYKQDIII